VLLLKNARVFAPRPLGVVDVLVTGERVEALVPAGTFAASALGDLVEVVDVGGARVIPGLIDGHVHLTGGGGESGMHTRVPPLALSALTRAGITACVGTLGTDVTTRTMRDLVATTLGLRAQGLGAWCWTGGYALPVQTLTGAVRDDIAFVDPVIGVGELAISDHRSSQPTFDELIRVASDCHVGGLMTGKAGVLHLHVGDGPRGLGFIRRALDETEIPARVFHPTHVNRQRFLVDEAAAVAQRGCTVDVTAFDPGDDGVSVEDVIGRWLDERLPPERLTVSSDGAGCLPTFDHEGVLVHMDIGRPETVTRALQELLRRGRALDDVLPFFTSNVARLLRLSGRGAVVRGGVADLVVLDDDHEVRDVLACGRWMVRDGRCVVRGTFEAANAAGDAHAPGH
jgi:beta-aspartyl-dipeptidase (metallo-type)